MRDRPAGVEVGSRSTHLSLAVELTDGFTGGRPLGSPRVGIDGLDAEPVVNPSGYRVFRDIPAGTVTLRVEGGDSYLDEVRSDVPVVDPTDPDAGVDATDPATLPVESVELAPSPAYRFPAGSTLVRGFVRTADGSPVPDATVSVQAEDAGDAPSTRSDGNGEFVLCFEPVTSADVAVVDGESLVRVDGSNPTLEAVHADHGTATETLPVPEGEPTVRDVTF